MTYLLIKNLHTLAAMVTITGFILRGYWMMTGSSKLRHRITRIAPHVVDTVFLLSGIAMLAMLSLNPLSQSWLLAKFAGLIIYILLGAVAVRRGLTLQIRTVAFVAALSVFAYIVGVALSKSPASWLAYLS
ncbi:MAG: SirB2 family protein [Gammaproteobacteria bacterium]|nr:SirB2 family protein [Gammaproteobacteria bacterium]